MKTIMLPYSDFSLDLSYLISPFDLSKFNSIYEKYFTNIELKKVQHIDVQFTLCDVYSVKLRNMKNISSIDKISTPSINASLLLSNSLFYFLVDLGIANLMASNIGSFLKNDTETFVRVGAGRFSNVMSKNILSLEEDETGRYYILISNRSDLLSSDELFNFSKHIINL
jgi:hypothetical protein